MRAATAWAMWGRVVPGWGLGPFRIVEELIGARKGLKMDIVVQCGS